MKVLLIEVMDPDHLYTAFSRALERGLEAAGADVSRFAFAGDRAAFARTLISGGFDAVVSFSSFLALTTAEGEERSIFDVADTAFVGWHFDHPLYVSHNFATPIARRISVFPSRDHLRFFEAAGFPGATAVGLAGAEPPPSPSPWRARAHGVLVQATWNGEPERVWSGLEPSPAKALLDDLADRLLDEPEVSLIAAWGAATAAANLPLGYDENTFGLMRAALNYVRRVDRVRIVRALAVSSLPVTVCGRGWDGALAGRTGLTLTPNLPFESSRGLYGEARVALGLNAANGGCERVLYGAMAGACALSDAGAELAGTFEPEREIAFYDRARPETVVEAAERLLDPSVGESMAEAGRLKALESSTWTERAKTILRLVREVQ